MRKWICVLILAAFVTHIFVPYAPAQKVMDLPDPGTRVALSPAFIPPLLKGVKIYPRDPFRLDFILDKGQTTYPDPGSGQVPERLIRYFLAALTVPEKDLWVNLSPYEKDRIVPEAFGQTEMGRDLLSQDYMLKQITASLLYPEGDTGRVFWARIYAQAREKFGTTDIPVDTFNKVWIVPAKAEVFENKNAAFVVESRLKVMLESDYLAQEKNLSELSPSPVSTWGKNGRGDDVAKNILREVIIPVLEKEVNEGRNFAQLRQVYNSLILGTWFKDKVRSTLLGKAYVDQQKISGVAVQDKAEKEKIWARYVAAFQKGVFDLVKEEQDGASGEIIPRKYFSGGMGFQEIKSNGSYIVGQDPVRVPRNFPVTNAAVIKMKGAPLDAAEQSILLTGGSIVLKSKDGHKVELLIPADGSDKEVSVFINREQTGSFHIIIEGGVMKTKSVEPMGRLNTATLKRYQGSGISSMINQWLMKELERSGLVIGTPDTGTRNLALIHLLTAYYDVEIKTQNGTYESARTLIKAHGLYSYELLGQLILLRTDEASVRLRKIALKKFDINGEEFYQVIRAEKEEEDDLFRYDAFVTIKNGEVALGRQTGGIILFERQPYVARYGEKRVVARSVLKSDASREAQVLAGMSKKISTSPLARSLKALYPGFYDQEVLQFLRIDGENPMKEDIFRVVQRQMEGKSPEEIVGEMDRALALPYARKGVHVAPGISFREWFLRPIRGGEGGLYQGLALPVTVYAKDVFIENEIKSDGDVAVYERGGHVYLAFLAMEAFSRGDLLLFEPEDSQPGSSYYQYLTKELIQKHGLSEQSFSIFLSFSELLLQMLPGIDPDKVPAGVSLEELKAAYQNAGENVRASMRNYLQLVKALRASPGEWSTAFEEERISPAGRTEAQMKAMPRYEELLRANMLKVPLELISRIKKDTPRFFKSFDLLQEVVDSAEQEDAVEGVTAPVTYGQVTFSDIEGFGSAFSGVPLRKALDEKEIIELAKMGFPEVVVKDALEDDFRTNAFSRDITPELFKIYKADLKDMIARKQAAGQRKIQLALAGVGEQALEFVTVVKLFQQAFEESGIGPEASWQVDMTLMDVDRNRLGVAQDMQAVNKSLFEKMPFHLMVRRLNVDLLDSKAMSQFAQQPQYSAGMDYVFNRNTVYGHDAVKYSIRQSVLESYDADAHAPERRDPLVETLNVFLATKNIFSYFCRPGTRYITEPAELDVALMIPGAKELTGDRKSGFYEIEDPGKLARDGIESFVAYVEAHAKDDASVGAHENIAQVTPTGGVDLTRGMLPLNVRSSGEGIQWEFDPATVLRFQKAAGFTPVILGVQPMSMSLPVFLGLSDNGTVQETPL